MCNNVCFSVLYVGDKYWVFNEAKMEEGYPKRSRSLAQAYQETSWMQQFSTHPQATPTSLEEPSTFPVLLIMSYSVSGYKSN